MKLYRKFGTYNTTQCSNVKYSSVVLSEHCTFLAAKLLYDYKYPSGRLFVKFMWKRDISAAD